LKKLLVNDNQIKTTNWTAFFLIVAFLILVPALISFLYLSGKGTENVKKETKVSRIAGQARVSITKAGFTPSTIQIEKGVQVTWTNNDSSPHRVASDPYPTHTSLPALDSEILAPKESFSFIFEKMGTFTYHDHLKPLKIRGTVIVK